MSTNPYEKFLAGGDPLTIIRETPNRVAALAKQMGDAGLQRRFAPGKWTAAQILCHLADVDIAFSFRLRQAIAEPHHVINPFEQDDWAKPYPHLDPHLALASFIALRNWTVNFLDTVPKTEYAKPVTHPERGKMTFQGLLETMAGHDLNHLAQLESIAGSK
jgi:hypothetical protein